MTRAERIELTAIGGVSLGSWPMSSSFPPAIPVWQIVLGLASLLLAQSLVRDITILIRRRGSRPDTPRRVAQCFCVESTVGMTGILAAAMLAGLGSSAKVAFHRWEYPLAIAGTMALGFFIKDWVISWGPLGLRREKDHLNLIVSWKGK